MTRGNLETTGDESEAVSLVGDMKGRPNRTTEPPFNEPLYKSNVLARVSVLKPVTVGVLLVSNKICHNARTWKV